VHGHLWSSTTLIVEDLHIAGVVYRCAFGAIVAGGVECCCRAVFAVCCDDTCVQYILYKTMTR